MLFHATYTYSGEHRDSVHRRFLDTRGAPPPGVTMLGRWHQAAGNGGFLAAETDDASALARWMQDWTDLIDFQVTPVVTDEAFAGLIG